MKLFNGKNEKNLSMESNSKREMFEKNGGTLYGLSGELIDYDLAFYAVKKMRTELNNVPYELIDEKIIVEAFSGLNWPEDFACFHLAKIDRSLVLKMVKINGMALSLVPDDMLDRDIILEAVKCKKAADVVECILGEVPEKLLDSEILLEAIKNSNDEEKIFERMIFNENQLIYGLIDRKIALEMVNKDGKTLKYIPYEMINEEILLEAIKNGCEVDDMVFIVEHLSDLDLPAKNDLLMKMAKLNAEVLSGVSNDYEYAFDVSKEEANKNVKYIVLETVRQNGLALEFVSSEIMDEEIALEAVRQNGLALEFVLSKVMNGNIAAQGIKQNIEALKYLKEYLSNKEFRNELLPVLNEVFAGESLDDTSPKRR